jgi:hypothetical protein
MGEETDAGIRFWAVRVDDLYVNLTRKRTRT